MRIAFVNHSRRKVGGVEVYLDAVIPALAGAGHEVACLFETDPPSSRETISVPAGTPTWVMDELGISGSVAALNAWNPDICFTHGLQSTELEDAIVEIGNAVRYIHDYYGTCISGNKTVLHNGVAVPCERKFGPACLLHYFPERCGGRNPLTMIALYRRQTRRSELMHRYRAVIADSQHMCRELARYQIPAHCLYYPLRSHLAPHPPVVPSESGLLRLIFSGRMHFLKGGELLVNALPEVQRRLLRGL